ncbi:multiple sugar transport system permease protein [Murinocardiopsis flavida]|uniref:Multiple sugar transport system permease protein n=1 Tax=Murinocardiopsis flavida TaxID=645275 RepID=A0A2P8CSX8_9ACTN|nr:ABC transporter permease subunit [Murinocardiopsis flavida]PSK88059.1 multiple sugar transport system permease protein [Murinocardiopsis flavida]
MAASHGTRTDATASAGTDVHPDEGRAAARRSGRGPGRRAGLWERTVPLRWLAPSTALIALVIVFPALYMGAMAFMSINQIGMITGFAGLDNFRTLFAEPALWPVVTNTASWLVVVVGITVVLSLALAQFLSKDFVGRRFVRLAVVVPWAASLVMTATVWRFLFEGGNGLLNRLLMDLSILSAPHDWYKDPSTAFASIMAVGVITSIPFTTYVLLAGLQSIPGDLHEAARIDGAGAWRAWLHVTLPMLRPSLLVALVLNMLHVFNAFTVIWVISGKTAGTSADTTVTWMYKIAFTTRLDPGEAAALAVLNVAFLVLLIAVFGLLLRPVRRPDAPVAAGPAAEPPREDRAERRAAPPPRAAAPPSPAIVALHRGWRRARPVVLPFTGLLVAAFFLAPYVAMFLGSLKTDAELFEVPANYLPREWAWSNYADVWRVIPLADYFRVSLTLALSATAVVLLVSAPAAYILARTEFRGKAAFLMLILVTQMFPAVALIIGLYREALFLGGVHQYWFIIAVNSAFNIAFAVWIMHAHFRSIPVEIEEAAMLDGLGRLRIMLRLIVPLSAPAIITVTIFTFIQVWNEFIVALTLFNDPPNGRVPLTVGVQQFVGLYETNYQYLFAAALMAIVPAVILFALIEKYLVSGLTTGSGK